MIFVLACLICLKSKVKHRVMSIPLPLSIDLLGHVLRLVHKNDFAMIGQS